MTMVWSPQTLHDVEEIFDYLLEENPAAAWAIHDRLLEHVEQLTDHPGMGRPGRVPGTRELIVPGAPCLIPYRVVSPCPLISASSLPPRAGWKACCLPGNYAPRGWTMPASNAAGWSMNTAQCRYDDAA